ncbi:neuropeptide F receptor [Folsomia candida]|uniref:neuropeptide F receptor n=1 Tax=Folsomia candida TaxID=158441 RepID=UPI000B8F4E4D|nr:neuropeptide F receptor [Folsomia candida]
MGDVVVGASGDNNGSVYSLPASLLELLQMSSPIDGEELASALNTLNKTSEEIRLSWKRYHTNLFIDGPMLYFLIFVYTLLISFGTVGNCLTVCAVVRKSSMRTPRNMFIINLAVSDLLLCVITMPLTLVQIVTAYWPFGNYDFLCKSISSLHAISIFVSTISITAIALDRYHVIVYPTKASVQRVGAVFALIGIWTLAAVLATPLIVYSKLQHIDVNYTDLDSVDYCIEAWPCTHGRAYYSLFSIIIQYILPISVVTVAYCQICKKLRYRMKPGCRSTVENPAGGRRGGSVRKDQARVRRTNMLLISIAIIFGISWMPLNVFNLVVDLFNPFVEDTYAERVAFAFCHMFGMSSANTNPMLYGFFNDNFRKEFRDIWQSLKSFYCCCCCWSGFRRGDGGDLSGRSIRESRVDREQTATVHYRKSTNSKASPPDGDVESTLITQVLDRQK